MSRAAIRGDGAFHGTGDIRLRYRSWEVPEPQAAIVLVHGFGDHSGRYDAVGEFFAGLDVSMFALDLRGHGRSEGRRGYVPRFDTFLEELDGFSSEVRRRVSPSVPLFLLGHSMGGLIALRYLETREHPFRGAVIVSPWLDTAMPVPRWKLLLAPVLDRVLPILPVPAGIRAEDLSHDPEVVRAYDNDPLVHGIMTPRLFREATAAAQFAELESPRLNVPLLFLLAGDDRIVDTDRSLSLARGLEGDVVIHTFDGRYHELLFEPDRDDILGALRHWVMERVG